MKLRKTLPAILMLLAFLSLGAQAQDEEENTEKVPGYVDLGKPMVLNLASDGRRLTFLQVKADVLVKDDDARDIVEQNIPAIRHQIIVILSEQKDSDMKSPAKREEIRKQITVAVREMIDEMTDNNDIEEILFSNFLVQ